MLWFVCVYIYICVCIYYIYIYTHIYIYIYMYVCVGVGRRPPQSRRLSRQRCTLACTRYCYNQYCMVYVIQKGHRGGVVYCAIIVQAREEAASASSTQMAEVRVGLYTILFHFKALLWEPIILACPPHLQSLPYCNTIARLLRNIRPPPPPPMPLLYVIHNSMLVMPISCQGRPHLGLYKILL